MSNQTLRRFRRRWSEACGNRMLFTDTSVRIRKKHKLRGSMQKKLATSRAAITEERRREKLAERLPSDADLEMLAITPPEEWREEKSWE